MTNDIQEALKWFSGATNQWYEPRNSEKHRDTILRLLDRPVMPRPEELPASVMVPIADRFNAPYADFRALYRALYEHYNPPPKAKKVECWAVINEASGFRATFDSREAAERVAGTTLRVIKLVEAADADA